MGKHSSFLKYNLIKENFNFFPLMFPLSVFCTKVGCIYYCCYARFEANLCVVVIHSSLIR